MNEASVNSKKNQVMLALVAVAILFALVGGTVVANHKDGDDGPAVTTANTQTTPSTSTTTSSAGMSGSSMMGSHKDGTYSATSQYQTPDGSEQISIKVTISNGIVTDSSVSQSPSSRTSQEYQDAFASGYKSSVVGKAIDTIVLSRVSGSSLTSDGFNTALDEIKTQAKA